MSFYFHVTPILLIIRINNNISVNYRNFKKKIEYERIVLQNLLLFFCGIMTLVGCGWNEESIPSAGVLVSGRVSLSWREVPDTEFYNIYISSSPGVNKLTGFKIRNETNSITITDLEPGKTYYFVVAAATDFEESANSKEISYTVTDTAGIIEFGDLAAKTKTKEKIVEPEEDKIVSAPEEKFANSRTDPKPFPASTEKPEHKNIICFGDSLTFGTGASRGMDYPSQLERIIEKKVINLGMPGDTTAWALQRLKRDVLSKNPDIVLITLGGNDLKNGVPKDTAFSNLKTIVQLIQKQGAKVIIGGFKFADGDRGFGKGYEKLAEQTGATLIPNIYEGIFGNRNLMSDPIHPNNKGYTIIAQRFLKAMAL